MADNTTINSGTGGDVIRDKDRTGVKTQIVGLDINPTGAEVLGSGDASNGLDVDVTRVQGTVAVSGPVTDTQLRASAVPVSLASAPTTAVTGPLTDTQLRASGVTIAEQADASTTGTMIALNGTVQLTVPAGATAWTVRLGGTFANASVVTFEGSVDSGSTWDSIAMVNRSSVSFAPSTSVTGLLVTSFLTNTWTGAATNLTTVRVRLSTFTAADSVTANIRTGTGGGVTIPAQYSIVQGPSGAGSASSGGPVFVGGQDGSLVRSLDLRLKGTQQTYGLGVQDFKDAGRTALNFYAVAAAAGATTVETAITLTKASGTSATSTAVSFTPTSGKRFRITQFTVATRGNASATIQETTFSLRINTAGAVTTSSTPIVLKLRSATPATASAWDRVVYEIPDGYEILGDGTLQWGVTANSTFVTNAPTWDVAITGFEY